MNRRALTLAVSSLVIALAAEACSGSAAHSDANTLAGSGGVADDAAGGPISDESGAGGVIAISGSGGSVGGGGATNGGSTSGSAGTSVSGAAGSAGNAAENRWIDPGQGSGCGPLPGSSCGDASTWGCAVPPSNPECQLLSDTANAYCCGEGSCIRDWGEDETFCPGAPIMLNCIESAAPARCTRYGTSKITWCCEP